MKSAVHGQLPLLQPLLRDIKLLCQNSEDDEEKEFVIPATIFQKMNFSREIIRERETESKAFAGLRNILFTALHYPYRRLYQRFPLLMTFREKSIQKVAAFMSVFRRLFW
jgi:hypothetical protein